MIHRHIRISVEVGRISRLRPTLSFCRHYSMQKEPDKGPTMSSSNVLLDSFKRHHTYLRISLTDRCNLRCRYCMPNLDDSESSHLFSPSSDLLTTDEIVRLATLFVRHGVDKIRLTGGEPTVRKDVGEIVKRLSGLINRPNTAGTGLEVLAMTSNGVALGRKLKALVQDGLTHLNLRKVLIAIHHAQITNIIFSLDTLDPFKFELITRRPHKIQEIVRSTLEDAISLLSPGSYPGLQKVKLNVVVIRNFNNMEVPDFVELTKTMPLQVRFIEFMPFAGNRWQNQKMVPSKELLDQLQVLYPTIHPINQLGGMETAREYHIPGYQGSVGFISSMSDHFCATCNRLRITADGQIKVCLFDGKEVSLRDLLRSGASDEQLLQVIQAALAGKKAQHGGMDVLQENVMSNRAMINIGLKGKFPVGITRQIGRTHRVLPFILPKSYEAAFSLRRYSSSTKSSSNLSHLDGSGRPQMVDVSSKEVTERAATAVGNIQLNEFAFQILRGLSTDDTSHQNGAQVTGGFAESSSREQEERLAKTRIKAGNIAAGSKDDSANNILTVAQLAGIMAAKSTSSLIPLCHSLPLTHVNISFTFDGLGSKSSSDSQSQTTRLDENKNSQHKEEVVLRCECTVRCSGRTGVEMEALTGVSVALLTVWDMLKAVAGKEMVISDIKLLSKSGGKSGFVRNKDS